MPFQAWIYYIKFQTFFIELTFYHSVIKKSNFSQCVYVRSNFSCWKRQHLNLLCSCDELIKFSWFRLRHENSFYRVSLAYNKPYFEYTNKQTSRISGPKLDEWWMLTKLMNNFNFISSVGKCNRWKYEACARADREKWILFFSHLNNHWVHTFLGQIVVQQTNVVDDILPWISFVY